MSDRHELLLRIAKRIACSQYSWGNCSFEEVDGKMMYRDGCDNIREKTAENSIIYYAPDHSWAKNMNEIWEELTEETKDLYFTYAYAAFVEMSKQPIKEMYAMMFQDYLDEK